MQQQPTTDLERSVLGAFLVLDDDEPLPEWANEVTPDMFTVASHQQIAMAIDELRGDEGGAIDLVTVTDKLKSWGLQSAATVAEIADEATTTAHLNYHARQVIERAQIRRAREQVGEALKDAETRKLEDVQADLAAIAETLQPKIVHSGFYPAKEVLRTVLQNLADEHAGSTMAVETGLRVLDANLKMMPGGLTTLAGRPSMGKTALALHIARNAAKSPQRGSVAVFSLEMPATDLIQRALTSESGVPTGDLAREVKFGTVSKAINAIHKLDLWINDKSGLPVAAMRAALAKLNKVQLVAIDYLQLIKLGRGERRDLLIGDATKALKAMAKEFGCHVIALSQLSRKVEDRRPPLPRLSDLRDSGSIEEDSDNVLLLYRPAYYMHEDADPELIEVDIAKQRNGPTPAVKVRWKERQQRFEEW